MATIISSKKKGDKIIAQIASEYEEFLHLRGHLENVRFFSENTSHVQTNISQRGKNEATKYFLIPRQFRNGFEFNNTTSCQKIEFGNKVFFIYVVDKTKTNPSRREIAIKKINEKYSFI